MGLKAKEKERGVVRSLQRSMVKRREVEISTTIYGGTYHPSKWSGVKNRKPRHIVSVLLPYTGTVQNKTNDMVVFGLTFFVNIFLPVFLFGCKKKCTLKLEQLLLWFLVFQWCSLWPPFSLYVKVCSPIRKGRRTLQNHSRQQNQPTNLSTLYRNRKKYASLCNKYHLLEKYACSSTTAIHRHGWGVEVVKL